MRPAYQLVINGTQDITGKVQERLLSLEITDKAGVESDRLTLTLDDRDGLIAIPETGAVITASIGYLGGVLTRMGNYVVDEVDLSGPARELTIRANAANMTGEIKAPKERSFDDVTFGDIVQTIAQENGLTASIPETLASIKIDHADQTESDMQFLTRLCADQGATVKIADTRLVVSVRAAGVTASGAALPQVVIAASMCESWSVTLAGRGKYKSVQAYYHDGNAARRKSVKAGSGSPVLSLKNSYSNKAEAQRAADSKFQTLSRGTRKASINGLIGDPLMSAEKIAVLTGFRGGVDGGGWVVDEVRHSLSSGGYTCDVMLESQD